jgi:hypothetical protein
LRTGGLISDWLGEIRLEEPELFESDLFGHSRLITWKGGRFELGYPLGMPLGVDGGIGFQVYTAGAFCSASTEPQAQLPVAEDEINWFEILGVATHLMGVDQSNVIERSLGRRVKLAWPASSSPDAGSYRIYHDNRTGTVDYDTVIDEVEAKPGGIAAASRAWTSGELEAGTWKFGLRAVDEAGNEQTSPVRETQVTLTPVCDPPAQISHSYSDTTHRATLTWAGPERWV